MSGMIRKQDLEYVREHTPIDEVVGVYVQLKSAGGGAKKGLCPFHDEKSPSFHVTPSKGFFHCFGCQVSGDAFSFLMKMEHLTFTEAVEKFADRIGYILTYEKGSVGVSMPASVKARLISAHFEAAKFYQDQLNTSSAAEFGRDLLTKRGFDKKACEQFGVGYAPDDWDALTKHLRALNYTIDELETAGLSKMGQRGPIDKFRNRLMWPIKDISGDVIGFGARKLASDEVDQGPKYLNTGETPIYKKSKVLYGLDVAKKEIAKKRQVVIVEGYTDVMAAHLAGVTTAVATCGTAFGGDHIRIIRNLLMDDDSFRGEVIFTFDGDEAGQKAALRAFSEDQKFVTQTFVSVEPSGLDPCELRQQQGDLALRDLIARRVPLFEFAIRAEIAKYSLGTPEGRINALNATAPIVAQIKEKSLRPEYVKSLAGWLGLEMEIVSAAVLRAGKSQPVASVAQVVDSVEVENWRPNPNDARLILEREVLKSRVQEPQLFESTTNLWSTMEQDAFTHPAYKQLRKVLDENDGLPNIENIADERMKALFTELSVEPIKADGKPTPVYVASIVARLREVAISRSIAELKSSLQRLNPIENEIEYNAAFVHLVGLESEKRILHDLAIGGL